MKSGVVLKQHDDLRAAARTADRHAAHQTGRIAALEATIAHWQHAPHRPDQSGEALVAVRGKAKTGCADPAKRPLTQYPARDTRGSVYRSSCRHGRR
jgi:hypothetical protein